MEATTKSNTGKNLAFVIDITGSMSNWISALKDVLPSLIQSMALTMSFDSIAIMGYSDYEGQDTITWFSDFCSSEGIEKLKKFAADMKTIGGGGPEASKTGIFDLTKFKHQISGKLYILHLCDQPPHTNYRMDTEGKKEKEALGAKFDTIELTKYIMEVFPQVTYYCLTTAPDPCYCYMAQTTGGYVFALEGQVTMANLRFQMSRVFNGWFGSDNTMTGYRVISHLNFATEDELGKVGVETVIQAPAPEKLLATSLLSSVALMKTDPAFLEHVISELRTIIQTSPMSLTVTPVLGKMWREFCKRRSDIRRDELIELLSRSKHTLGTEDKAVMEKWLTESYNSQAEIEEDIKKFMKVKETVGLLRFIPEDNSLCAQKIIQLLAAGDRKSTSLIRAILGRMYVDTQYKHAAVDLDEDAPIPLPESSMPLNVYDNVLFEMAMHTVVPGTKLTRRYAAMLALHAIQCGSVLQERAHNFLQRIKGSWISWKRREDQSPEIPDNFSVTFLDLILHPTCIQYLTEEEIAQATFFKKISYLLRYFNQLSITVKVLDTESIDGVFPDHMVHCPDCNADRPLSIISHRGICGHCEMMPKPTDTQYVSVRCYTCAGIYSRDISAIVQGKSKCYNCRQLLPPSPSVTCSSCNFKFIQFYKTEEGLPNNACGACTAGIKSRSLQFLEYSAFAHQVFKEIFPKLCAILGFRVSDTFKGQCGIPEAVLHITEGEKVENHGPPETVLFRDTYPVLNKQEIWEYILSVLAGGEPELPDCSICLERLPASEMVPACGRRGCQQRVCNPCGLNWYSKNHPGNLLYQRSLLCQFCSRIPSPHTLSRVDNNLIALATQINKNPLNPDMYYGWCTKCLMPKEIAERSCTTEPPKLTNFTCSDCISGSSISVVTKDCPKCNVAVSKISGCNHISCNCGAHWCWKCGQLCASSGEVYGHMNSVHGSFFDDEVLNYVDDE